MDPARPNYHGTDMWVCDLGELDYRSALELQHRLRRVRQDDLIPDTTLLVEHNPAVYTRGRRSAPGELSMGEAWYAERGIEIIETKRGGKVTYHGPGQLVGYPIVRVDDVLAYVRLLERVLVVALDQVGVSARTREDEGPTYTGVWVQDRKIASIGVHVARAVTNHGFAINLEKRTLEPFTWVVACGLPEVQMTSIESERGDADITLKEFAGLATAVLADALAHTPETIGPETLEARLAAAETQLAAAETQLAAAETQLAAAETQLAAAETQLAAAATQSATTQEQLAATSNVDTL